MEEHVARDIIACLPSGRTLFYYFKDLYAVRLLSYLIGEGMTVAEIKASRFARLLEKPAIKEILSRTGTKLIHPKLLEPIWPELHDCYRLSLGLWGHNKYWYRHRAWNQTSRPGVNLVLQLNFSSRHNRTYKRLIKPGEHDPFTNYGHPVAGDGSITLAWARLDIDFDRNEALIEEIQTDWIRNALGELSSTKVRVRNNDGSISIRFKRKSYYGCETRALISYIRDVLAFHHNVWDEAMLFAAVWFIKEELGLRRVYLHTFDTGNLIKNLDSHWQPPRSVYTTLPKKFCFERIGGIPDLLAEHYKKQLRQILGNHKPEFWRLEL